MRVFFLVVLLIIFGCDSDSQVVLWKEKIGHPVLSGAKIKNTDNNVLLTKDRLLFVNKNNSLNLLFKGLSVLDCSKKGCWIAGGKGENGVIVFYGYEDKFNITPLIATKPYSEIFDIEISPDENFIVSSHSTGEIILWDARELKESKRIKVSRLETYSIEFSRDGRLIFIGGALGMISAWDVKNGEKIFEIETGSKGIYSLVVLPDNNTIVVGGASGVLRFYDVSNGTLIRTIEVGNEIMVCDAQEIIVCGLLNGSVLVVYTSSYYVVFNNAHKKEVTFVKVSLNKKQFMTASKDGWIKGWQGNIPKSVMMR